MLCMHQHTWNETRCSLPLLFNWNGSVTLHHITLARVHILNCIQLAEHWGGILCKFLITSVHDWIHSVSSQSSAHIQHIYSKCVFARVCAHVHWRTQSMLCLLTMSVSAQTSGIKTVKLLKLTATWPSCSAFYRDLKGEITHLFRSSTSGCLSRVKLLFLV